MSQDRLTAKERAANRQDKFGGGMGDGGTLEDYNFGNRLTGQELKYLNKDQGMDRAEVMQSARDQGIKIGGNAKKYNARQNAKSKAQAAEGQQFDATNYGVRNIMPHGDQAPIDQGGTPMQPAVEPYGPYGDHGSKGSVGIGGNLEQGIGKNGDMNTSIGNNNTFGPGASIGNDYSVTIGSQTVGGSGGSAGGTAFNNMMSAASYNALNDNAFAKSQSQMNGYGRSQGAIEQASAATGATDRVGALYNMVGHSQNYWNNKAIAHQGNYLGDIFKMRAPDYKMPDAPNKVEDNTEEIADDFSEKIKDV